MNSLLLFQYVFGLTDRYCHIFSQIISESKSFNISVVIQFRVRWASIDAFLLIDAVFKSKFKMKSNFSYKFVNKNNNCIRYTFTFSRNSDAYKYITERDSQTLIHRIQFGLCCFVSVNISVSCLHWRNSF